MELHTVRMLCGPRHPDQRGAYVLGYLVPTPRVWTAQSPRLLGYREEIHKFLVGVGALAIARGSSDRNDQEQA